MLKVHMGYSGSGKTHYIKNKEYYKESNVYIINSRDLQHKTLSLPREFELDKYLEIRYEDLQSKEFRKNDILIIDSTDLGYKELAENTHKLIELSKIIDVIVIIIECNINTMELIDNADEINIHIVRFGSEHIYGQLENYGLPLDINLPTSRYNMITQYKNNKNLNVVEIKKVEL